MPTYLSQSATTTTWLGYAVNDATIGYLTIVGLVLGVVILTMVIGYGISILRKRVLGRRF